MRKDTGRDGASRRHALARRTRNRGCQHKEERNEAPGAASRPPGTGDQPRSDSAGWLSKGPPLRRWLRSSRGVTPKKLR